jgi:hypothetical protein
MLVELCSAVNYYEMERDSLQQFSSSPVAAVAKVRRNKRCVGHICIELDRFLGGMVQKPTSGSRLGLWVLLAPNPKLSG